VEVLRTPEWIARNGLEVGSSFDLQLSEIELDGQGFVHAIQDGPEVLPGPGAVVTGRFVTRRADNLVRVAFEGGASLTGTETHPVWSPDQGDWRGLGEFQPGDRVQTRDGFAVVARIEPLAESAPVYNIEVAGQHVYEVTDLGVLVHNAGPWNCDEFLKLRKKVADPDYGIDSLSKEEAERYNQLRHLIRERFRDYVNPKALDELEKLKRSEADHLHHILPMFGIDNKAIQQRIVDLQIKLWDEFDIDPFTSAEMLTYAPMSGVHGKDPTMVVILALEDAVKGSKKGVLDRLNQLGDAARRGRMLAPEFLDELGLRLSDLEI
jgi:hypothetical protein